jgi:CDP-glucose 4,6-dehydratase
LEKLVNIKTDMFSNIYNNQKVLLTGHTGFKGSWLAEWLIKLGANVHGIALDPDVNQPLFNQLGLNERITEDIRQDIRMLDPLIKHIKRIKPDFIFHLAAQPLVRLSYETPLDTFSINVMGTINLLEAVRQSGHPCSVVIITTDKCYENKEWVYGYREVDPMGGSDPYSASKGCAELAVSSYRRSYFTEQNSNISIASARAGNVIGGGDFALDRIVPDCIRSIQNNNPIIVRNKSATRPWQHVLEPLSGYLWLGACLKNPQINELGNLKDFASGFNFGPELGSNKTVGQLVDELIKYFPKNSWEDLSHAGAVHEASKLNLVIDKAFHYLGWKPVWGFEKTIEETALWYKENSNSSEAGDITRNQIDQYCFDAQKKEVFWAIR